MSNTREKLIELLYEAEEQADKRCDGYENCDGCPADNKDIPCEEWLKADCLLRLGVTVQKWIPVTERLPEENVRVLVCFRFTDYSRTEMDTDRIEKGKWHRWSKYVTHWMPLPEPPKGE